MNLRSILGVIVGMTLVATSGTTTLLLSQVEGYIDPTSQFKNEKAPPYIVGDNV
jgi:hypothetical protein